MHTLKSLIMFVCCCIIDTVMQGVSLSPQHPLILTYYCISLTRLAEKYVECGIVQLAVQHLKKLEMFMTLTGVSIYFAVLYVHYIFLCASAFFFHLLYLFSFLQDTLTLAKLLMSFLFSCCDSQAAVTIMVQNQLHQSLPYYIQMFEFNTSIIAKGALAVHVLSANIDRHFLQLVKLKDKELSNVQQILMLAIETKSLYIRLMDRQASNDYHVIGFLKALRHLTTSPDNLEALGSSVFINIYHSMLLEPALHDALKNILLLIKSVCSHVGIVSSIQKDHGDFLVTLEQLTVGEELQDLVIEVIWSIMSGTDSTS